MLWATAATFGVGLLLLLTAVIFAMLELRAALDPVELEEDFVTRLSEEVQAVRDGSDRGRTALAAPRTRRGRLTPSSRGSGASHLHSTSSPSSAAAKRADPLPVRGAGLIGHSPLEPPGDPPKDRAG